MQSHPTVPRPSTTPLAQMPQSYLIIVIQSHPFQSHNLVSLPVFSLEYCSIGA